MTTTPDHTTPVVHSLTITGNPETLRRALLAATLYTANDPARPHLCRLALTGNQIEATNAYHAVRINSAEIMTTAGDNTTNQLPAEIAARIAAELATMVKTTKHHTDRAAHVTANPDTGSVLVTITTGDKELASVTFTADTWTDLAFPNMDTFYNDKPQQAHNTTLAPRVLDTLAKLATTLAGSKKNAEQVGIRFHAINPRKPARISVSTTTTSAQVVAMPMRDEWPETTPAQ